MGGRKAGLNANRSEFTPENGCEGAIEYLRTGGCFVTTKKVIASAIFAVVALVVVIGAVLYFYGPTHTSSPDDSSSDIEILLSDSLNDNTESEDSRLQTHLQPLHYRLRIHPYLDEPNSNNFTFTGKVTILMQCNKLTKKIILNSEELHILTDEVTVVTTTSLELRSLSQVVSAEGPSRQNATFGNISPPNLDIVKPEVVETNPAVHNVNLNGHLESNSSTIPPLDNVPTTHKIPTVAGITETVAVPPMPTLAPTPATLLPILPTPLSGGGADATNSRVSLDIPNGTIPNVQTNQIITTTIPPNALPPTEYTSLPDHVYKAAKIMNIRIKSHEDIKKMSRYVIHLSAALQPGINYTLDIKFAGNISNNLVGLYKTSYSDVEGHKRWLLTTQFQPIFARRAFPCFDEPDFKSSFEISVARRTNMTALSNMPLRESEPMPGQTGWVWDHFDKSPPMSPYLVAFTVSDFENLKPATPDMGTVFNIWAPKQSIANAQYAVEIVPKILSYLQGYFDVKYPLSKIDLVAIPELSRTATENWGIISLRDTALLLDPSSDSWETRNYIFKTIARKLTGQWFGNLVTMDWWSELWLTEGFATYMEDVVENAIEPTLEDVDTFALRITQAIMDSDKLKSARSLHLDVKDPTQIEQLFDDVTSNKGSCLIRMLNYTLSEALFKEGVQGYLKKWAYQCSNQDSFFESLTQVSANKDVIPSDLSINDIMDSWIKQEGYPVVTVTRDYNTGNALITQNRYVNGNITKNNLWYIPLTYTRQTDNGAVTTLWLKKEESITTVNFTTAGNATWVIFNVEQAGFYRVNYDITNWKLLQNQLMTDPGKILSSNRGQLLNDAFELSDAGILNYTVPFELTKYLGPKERNYIPWHSVYNSLQTLEHILGKTQYNGIFQKYIIKTIQPLYDEVGISEKPGESQNDKFLRSFVINAACRNGYEPCMDWAKQKYQEWMTLPDPDKNNPIPFDFREMVQCTAIKLGGQKEWDFLWERTLYPSASRITLNAAYLSLGCSREPWLINSYLERSLNGSVPIHNVGYVWKSIAHPVGLTVGFTFLRTNWERIYESYKHIFGNLRSIFEDFLSTLSTETDLEDLTLFYKNNKEDLYPVSSLILSVVDRIKWRIYWTQSHLETVATWLLQNN